MMSPMVHPVMWAVLQVTSYDIIPKEVKKGTHTWGWGSKLLILREHRAQCKIVGYFSACPHQVFQEYSTKRDYVF